MGHITPVIAALRNELVDLFPTEGTVCFLYGSAASTSEFAEDSDVDVTVISVQSGGNVRQSAADAVLSVHREFGIRLDYAVPYENKVAYSYSDVTSALLLNGFRSSNGTTEVRYCELMEYLASDDFRLRLLLTSMATEKKVVFGSEHMARHLQKLAWDSLLELVRITQPTARGADTSMLIESFISGLVSKDGQLIPRSYKEYLGFPPDPKCRSFIASNLHGR
jgi:hypothetical protein